MTPEERRAHTRVPVNRPIIIKMPNDHTVFGTTSDLSLKGVGLFSQEPVPEGAQLEVHFEVEDNQDHRFHDYLFTGVVRHCIDTMEQAYHVGVELKETNEDYEQVFEHLISA
ncbi:PilZ domain-containing protein [Sulfurivirga caldicuralii]|uniref:PilZ domain-containing protein n=1 Tax=Sulfurivirga caldicuralii TaxID=364032 RepID=A0A1N6DHB2_9GAMM|nr:PilZ domain-containing protein [Sulfurivirga caldicuralii]SIN70219.1 PilZ domain-containing protein [Sulfurivirga caldicuralii]